LYIYHWRCQGAHYGFGFWFSLASFLTRTANLGLSKLNFFLVRPFVRNFSWLVFRKAYLGLHEIRVAENPKPFGR